MTLRFPSYTGLPNETLPDGGDIAAIKGTVAAVTARLSGKARAARIVLADGRKVEMKASGTDFVGKPKGWGDQWWEEYNDKRYHQPSDEYRPDFDLSGSVQLGEIVLRFARRIADSPALPTWNADAEFHRTAPPQP